MGMMDTQVKIDGIKCKVSNCVAAADESGYCEKHDPNRVSIPSNGIGAVLFIFGVVLIVSGIFTIFESISFGISLMVSGIVILGFAEIINLLHKIAYVSYNQYHDNRKDLENLENSK